MDDLRNASCGQAEQQAAGAGVPSREELLKRIEQHAARVNDAARAARDL